MSAIRAKSAGRPKNEEPSVRRTVHIPESLDARLSRYGEPFGASVQEVLLLLASERLAEVEEAVALRPSRTPTPAADDRRISRLVAPTRAEDDRIQAHCKHCPGFETCYNWSNPDSPLQRMPRLSEMAARMTAALKKEGG